MLGYYIMCLQGEKIRSYNIFDSKIEQKVYLNRE